MKKNATKQSQETKTDRGEEGLEMRQGRTFDGLAVSETNPLFVVNEQAARVMGLVEPVGQWLSDRSGTFKGTIVGLVKDYHFTPLRQKIEPLILIYYPPDCDKILARLKPGDISRTVAGIEAVWKKFAPAFPFRFNFLDEALDDLYRSEERVGAIIRSFSLLAVVVSCLGLFGLASFTAERRTKEIGIRKVLGATGPKIVWLLSREFSSWRISANSLADWRISPRRCLPLRGRCPASKHCLNASPIRWKAKNRA